MGGLYAVARCLGFIRWVTAGSSRFRKVVPTAPLSIKAEDTAAEGRALWPEVAVVHKEDQSSAD